MRTKDCRAVSWTLGFESRMAVVNASSASPSSTTRKKFPPRVSAATRLLSGSGWKRRSRIMGRAARGKGSVFIVCPLKFKVSSARFYSISAKINQFLKIWTNLHCDLTIHSGDNLPRTRRNETRQESGVAGGVRREGKPQAKMKKGNGKSTEECPCPKSRTCPEKPSSPSQTKL